LRCFTYVLNENVFSKKMIYESRNVICKNDNIIWNYVWMHAKAQRLGGDYVPNTPMKGRGETTTTLWQSRVTCLTPWNYKRDKLLAILRLCRVTLCKLLRISGSINPLIVMMLWYIMFYNVMCLKCIDFN
jgi:hypothetical protein